MDHSSTVWEELYGFIEISKETQLLVDVFSLKGTDIQETITWNSMYWTTLGDWSFLSFSDCVVWCLLSSSESYHRPEFLEASSFHPV